MAAEMSSLRGGLFFGEFFRAHDEKKRLLGLWRELDRNFERFCVMDQRQFMTDPFDVKEMGGSTVSESVGLPESFQQYALAVRVFNAAMAAMKDFEKFYRSVLEHKTRANAEILHAKQETVAEDFESLRPLIKTAHEDFRLLLKQRKLI